jgi:hypothetical protein
VKAEGGGGNAVTSVAGPWRAGLPSRGMGTVGRRRGGGWGWWGAGGSSLSSAPPLLLFLYRWWCRRGGGWRGGALASRAERRRFQLELNSSALPSLLLSPPVPTVAPAQPWAAVRDELHGERRGWSSVTTTEDEDLRRRGRAPRGRGDVDGEAAGTDMF